MKLLIASDIHGSWKYTKKLEELIYKEKPNQIILLGDILYHGPRNDLPEEYNSMEVAKILNKYNKKIVCVRGNCDSEVDDAVTTFDLREDCKEIEIDGTKFILTHGHLNMYLSEMLENNMSLQGHTHIYQLEGNVINPGSVGIPKRNKEHTCIIYEDKIFKLINLDDFTEIATRQI